MGNISQWEMQYEPAIVYGLEQNMYKYGGGRYSHLRQAVAKCAFTVCQPRVTMVDNDMPAMQPWYNAAKAAQVAAFFARREGGSINVLKLTKLVYIADRRNLEKFDFPITWDNFVSMDHGPVNSITYDCINGMHGGLEDWERHLTGRSGYSVGLAGNVDDEDLDQLSEAELETLAEVWAEFGQMSQYQVRDWTHANCPEWEDPHGSSNPIPLARILKFLGKKYANELEDELLAERHVKEVFA